MNEEIRSELATAAVTKEWVAQTKDRLKALQPEPVEPVVQPRFLPQAELNLGDNVWVSGLQATGEITELAGTEAEVQVGSFRIRAKVEDLELRQRASKPEAVEREVGLPRASSPGLELNLLGLTPDEALPRPDKHLNAV